MYIHTCVHNLFSIFAINCYKVVGLVCKQNQFILDFIVIIASILECVIQKKVKL